jgi:hypothetical protein
MREWLPPGRSQRARAFVVLALGCAAVGCAPVTVGRPPRDDAPPAQYQGDQVLLFDDLIEPKAVGMDLEAHHDPRFDATFRTRAQSADMVMRARVETVTGLDQGPAPAYRLGFHLVDRLGGHKSPGDDFTIKIDEVAPAIGVLKAFGGRLVGKTFVLFVKSFVGEEGDPVLHFHATADSAEVLAAVKEAVVLDEVK